MSLPPLCAGSGLVDPPRHRHGFRCPTCGWWWMAQLILAIGYLPGHTIAPARPHRQPWQAPARPAQPLQLALPIEVGP